MNEYEILFTLFSKYEKPRAFPTCECCINTDEMKRLLSINLKQLSAEDLSEYASSVFLTVGSKRDFQYFFPRIFQLALEQKFDWPDQAIVFRAINISGWNSWNTEERNVVINLTRLKFKSLLKGGDGSQIDELLCAISHIEKDLSHYLTGLKNSSGAAFNSFIDWNANSYTKGKLSGFWEDSPEQAKQVMSWMRNDRASTFLFSKYGMKI